MIPQRELRNNVSEVLRAAEAGETFTITVRGQAVARLGPPQPIEQPRVDVDRATLRLLLRCDADGNVWASVEDAAARERRRDAA